MSELRVLIVTSWYPNKSNPVNGTFVREQAKALAQNEHVKVGVFYPSDLEARHGDGSSVSSYSEFSVDEGIDTYRANLRFEGNPVKYLFGGFMAARELKKIIGLFKPDILHVHVSFPSGLLTDLATLGTSIPYVMTEHMSYLHEYTEKTHYRLLLKHAFERASKVLVVSSLLAQQLDKLNWNIKPQVLPNIVDTSRFNIENATHDAVSDTVNILFVGGMDQREIKGLQYLLPAFAKMLSECSRNKKPHLHLVGDGVKRSEYQQLVQKLRISEYCTFYGALPPDILPKLYNQCDFFVMSSLKETFGVVLIESLACGKPVLATTCGGPESIVTKEVGLLVEKESVQALEEGLRKMITSYKDYSPETIRQYAENNYSAKVISRKLISIYQEVLASSNQT